MKYYVDGSSRNNPGAGGFGVVILDDNENLIGTYSEQTDYTTNNEQEMKAIIWASCYAITHKDRNPIIYSDSAYAINSFTKWMFNWERNNWLKKDGTKPENLSLIKAFFEIYQERYIELIKVKGHSGNYWNEYADRLATGKNLTK